jgi:hypothetical protein
VRLFRECFDEIEKRHTPEAQIARATASDHDRTTGNVEDRSRDPRRLFRRQKDRACGDIGRKPRPAGGMGIAECHFLRLP